ncbi:UTRA domain-containing protein [Heyndrickxia coagulans]|jgi:GntR family frlABCD operon transcriptional regulator|uniref:UTRA domain-containing protein n=1 Tax=Heyndrickxia TaxID=2837504 RepID=UPI0021B40350|nr:UTRA domain-containing protein [Heyndrickxia coagulans]UXC22760.1 UTRA domain-containing protein [Heyndrickxia coagulans]
MNINTSLPLYTQVKRKIIEEISGGIYNEGGRLPAEPELCQKYDVSRVTLRRSLQELVNEGYLVRKQGKGTYITNKKIVRSLISLDGYTEYMEKTGKKPQRKIIEKTVKLCPPLVAQRLFLPSSSRIIELLRVMYVKDVLLGYEVNSYPVVYFEGLENDLNDKVSTHALLKQKYGTVLKNNYKILNVVLADEKMAGLLKCSISEPLFQLDKTAFNQNGIAVYHSMMYYDVNRVSFIIEK